MVLISVANSSTVWSLVRDNGDASNCLTSILLPNFARVVLPFAPWVFPWVLRLDHATLLPQSLQESVTLPAAWEGATLARNFVAEAGLNGVAGHPPAKKARPPLRLGLAIPAWQTPFFFPSDAIVEPRQAGVT